MIATMAHEEFYTTGTYSSPEVNVYAGWTALDGAFGARQPFFNGQRDVALLISGECFAGESSSRDLDYGDGDGECHDDDWLIRAYEQKGPEFVESLNGSFSGLLIDKRAQKVLLFNDRYGLDRIYWHEAKDGFYFASEAKALLRVLPDLREFDPQGVAQFITFGCTVNWGTLFRSVRILPGGSRWTFQQGRCKRQRYFTPEAWECLSALSEEGFQEQFQETFKRIIPRYCQADRRLGIALTGGLDTRMILAAHPEGRENRISYTFTGQIGETFDDRLAAEVAKVCGLEHHLLRLGDDFFSDFRRHADRTVYVTDGCLGVTGAHEIYFNRLAREISTVRLTGLFGSEILRGVSTFKATRMPGSVLAPELEEIALNSNFQDEADAIHPITSAAFRNIPWNLFGSLTAARSQVVLRSPYLDNELVALAFRTPAALRKSPQAALQLIARNNPLLARIPTDRLVEDKGKRFPRNIRRLVREFGFKLDYLHNQGMPHWLCRLSPLLDVVDARFRVFGHHKFLHYRDWFRNVLSPYLLEVLTDPQTEQSGIWRRGALERISIAHIQGDKNYVLTLGTALTLEAVRRLLFRDFAKGCDSCQIMEREALPLCK
jgi:asparagine synthase (glutamine-hydrolysing)